MSPEEQTTNEYTPQDGDHDFLIKVLSANTAEVSTETKIRQLDAIGLRRELTDEEERTVRKFWEELRDSNLPISEKVRLREKLMSRHGNFVEVGSLAWYDSLIEHYTKNVLRRS